MVFFDFSKKFLIFDFLSNPLAINIIDISSIFLSINSSIKLNSLSVVLFMIINFYLKNSKKIENLIKKNIYKLKNYISFLNFLR